MPLLDHALAANTAGLCVIPARQDGSKRPFGEWKRYQSTRPDEAQLRVFFANGATGLGYICGHISGGLEMLELEGRAVDAGLDQQLLEACQAAGLGDLIDRLYRGYWEQTPSGGFHWLYRCTDITGNLKLARRPSTPDEMQADPKAKVQVLIETRGEGGFTVAAPSHGTVHPTGRPWQILDGSVTTIPVITPAERAQLLEVCRSFDQLPDAPAVALTSPAVVAAPVARSTVTDIEPWDDFDQRTSGQEILLRNGFTLHGTTAKGTNYTRPGKNIAHGSSATVWADNGTTTLFSSSIDAPAEALDEHRKLRPSQLATFLEHHGDFPAFTSWARRTGYGTTTLQRTDPIYDLIDLDPNTPTPAVAATPPPPPTVPILPNDFWESRPILAHIRQAAHNRIRSADLVLHAVLARVAAYTPHTLELPPIAGSVGSLNYMAAAIGPSGSGKSSGTAIAGELVPRPAGLNIADNQPLGSGEGLAELYMGTEEEDDGKNGKKQKVRRQVRHNAFVYGDEGAALTAMMERRGATLPEAIRRAWTGADLGQANANIDRTRVIHAGNYRLGLLVGFQPELAGKLLADSDAGTPQRFTWAYAVDPNIPDDLPEWPGELPVRPLDPNTLRAHKTMSHGYVRHRLTIDPTIVTELQDQAKARVRGTTTLHTLDAHEPLHRLKLAALLAILDGRLDITLDDWALSATIWTTSCAVRATVIAAIATSIERTEAARTDQQARRELVVQAARLSAPHKLDRIARRMARWVHDAPDRPDDGWPARALQARLASTEKQLFEAALTAALEHAWITDEYGRYKPGESSPA